MRAVHSRSRGLTYIDVLVVLCLLGCIGAMQFGAIFGARERANRVKCASNLRQIGQSLFLYALDQKCYPRTRFDEKSESLNFFTGVRAQEPFEKNGPVANDVSAVLYMLLRTVDLSHEVFLCPSQQELVGLAKSQKATGSATPQAWWPTTQPSLTEMAAKEQNNGSLYLRLSNFPGPGDLNYGISNPYPPTASISVGYKWSPNVPADWAIAADQGPGGDEILKLKSDSPAAEMRKGNSRNHNGEGQNVLFNDGHVEWSTTPFIGADRDNIYTRAATRLDDKQRPVQQRPAASEPGTAPATDLDSVILPASGQKSTEKK